MPGVRHFLLLLSYIVSSFSALSRYIARYYSLGAKDGKTEEKNSPTLEGNWGDIQAGRVMAGDKFSTWHWGNIQTGPPWGRRLVLFPGVRSQISYQRRYDKSREVEVSWLPSCLGLRWDMEFRYTPHAYSTGQYHLAFWPKATVVLWSYFFQLQPVCSDILKQNKFMYFWFMIWHLTSHDYRQTPATSHAASEHRKVCVSTHSIRHF